MTDRTPEVYTGSTGQFGTENDDDDYWVKHLT